MTTKILKFSLLFGLFFSLSSMLQGQCIECFDEPFEEVCVEDADGNIIPFPNACFAECIGGFTSDDFVDCEGDGFNGNGIKVLEDVEVMSLGKLNLSPNPVTDKMTIRFKSDLGETNGTISVHSIEGKELIRQQIQIFNGNNIAEIDANDLLPGIYLLSLETTDGIQTLKFVK